MFASPSPTWRLNLRVRAGLRQQMSRAHYNPGQKTIHAVRRISNMSIKVAINGYGRIGRNVLRAIYETGRSDEFEVVVINGPADFKTAEHLTRRDTVHGPFAGEVALDGDHLVVNGDRIRLIHNRDPSTLPWGELGIDIVLECTGAFNSREKSSAHLDRGAGKALISAPAGTDMPTVAYGVDRNVSRAGDRLVSCASCTTNGLGPPAQP